MISYTLYNRQCKLIYKGYVLIKRIFLNAVCLFVELLLHFRVNSFGHVQKLPLFLWDFYSTLRWHNKNALQKYKRHLKETTRLICIDGLTNLKSIFLDILRHAHQ